VRWYTKSTTAIIRVAFVAYAAAGQSISEIENKHNAPDIDDMSVFGGTLLPMMVPT
jgi:hypothetical protein